MKTPNLIVILCLLLAYPLVADTANSDAQTLSPSEVETLVAPIALYPDALVAIILPASANSTEIVLAARYIEKGGSIDQADSQPWDESVRSLAHYPEVLNWMDENLEWTQQLGVTFLAQSEEIMAAIQRLRARALALGNLPSTGQLTVFKEDNYIRIVPAEPEVIYVPYYDPDVIFVSRFYWGFGPAWVSGPWLFFDCNWISRSIWIGTWHPHHFYRPPWGRVVRRPPSPHFVDRHTWRPDPRRIAAHPRPPVRPGHIARPGSISSSNFNRHGQPPPGSQRPANLTGRQSPSQPQAQLRGGDTRTQPSSAVRPARRPQRNPDANNRSSRPEQRQPREGSRPRVSSPASPPPSQAAQQVTETTRATSSSESSRQAASSSDNSDSKSSSSTSSSSRSTSNSSRSTGSSESRSSYQDRSSSQSRSSYQERSSRSSSSSPAPRNTAPSSPRESRSSGPRSR